VFRFRHSRDGADLGIEERSMDNQRIGQCSDLEVLGRRRSASLPSRLPCQIATPSA
jgi:hypothetical protein